MVPDSRQQSLWLEIQKSPLGDDITKETFDIAVESGAVAEYLDGEISLDDLERRLVIIEDSVAARKRIRLRAREASEGLSRSPDYRLGAIAEIFATEAATLDEVVTFRKRHLAGGLIGWADLADWIASSAEQDGEPTAYVTIPLDDDGKLAVEPAAIHDHREIPRGTRLSRSIELLDYLPHGETAVRRIPTRAAGVLGELKAVAQSLVRRYDWAEAHSTLFVLTGVRPPARKARVTTHVAVPWHHSRRTLSIEVPLTTPPAYVERLYREARSKELGVAPRPRRISAQHAELAVFSYARRKDHTWAEIRQQWDLAHPDQKQGNLRSFSRACRAAFARITNRSVKDALGPATGNH